MFCFARDLSVVAKNFRSSKTWALYCKFLAKYKSRGKKKDNLTVTTLTVFGKFTLYRFKSLPLSCIAGYS